MDIIATLIPLIKTDYIHALETGTIRSYEEKHESTRWFGENIKNGDIISVDNSPEAIKISKDICKHLNNIKWIEDDSVKYLKTLDNNFFDIILLDSVNDKDHIYEEFKIALKLIKTGGILVIDDFGVSPGFQIPDPTQPTAQKGREVFNQLKSNNLMQHFKIHQTYAGTNTGTQAIFLNVSDELKNFNFSGV